MSALVWDKTGDHLYETGVSKGVLYTTDGKGIPWNGLISVEENESNEIESIYFDGIKFNDIVAVGDFSAVLKAFTYPDEFLFHEGIVEDQTGFYISNQPSSLFSLSYQTKIGDDIEGVNAGYKIHILYNLTATPNQKTYQTIGDSVEPIEFEWAISAIPEDIEKFRPTAHVIFDSRKVYPPMLADLESILYGGDGNDSHLPPLKSLSSYIRHWNTLIIRDNGDGTWTAESNEPGIITMLSSIEFSIVSDTITYLDSDTYRIWSTDKNENNTWLR